MNHLKMTVAGLGMLMLTACNGIFDDIYDEPEEIVPAKGQIVMNATSWTDWYYVDLPKLQKLTEPGDVFGTDNSGLDRCILQELRGAGARNHHLGEVKLATDGIEISLVSQGVTDTLLVYARHIVMGRHIVGAGRKRCASRKSRHIG